MCRACGTQFVSCLLLRVASGGSNINDGYVTVTSCDFGFACVEVSCNSHRNVSQFYHILNGAAVSNLPSETTLWLHHFYKVLYRTWKGIFDICLYFRQWGESVRNSVVRLFRKIAKSSCLVRHVCLSIYPSTRYSLDTTERIFMKTVEYFSKICRESWNFIKIWQE